jgi:hypothetical protein
VRCKKSMHPKRVMPKKMAHPFIGGAMGKKKGAPKGTKAHTYTEK